MNILWFSPTPSHPQNAGNRSRIFSLVKYFQKQGHHITFVYFAQEGNDSQAVAKMEDEWDEFYLIPFSGRNRKKSKGDLWGIDDWYEEAITENICVLLRQKTFDVVFCEYIFQSKVLEFFPAKCIKVIDTHDRFGGRAELLKRNGIQPDFFYTTPEQEAIGLNRADIVIAIQEEEAEYYRSITSAEVLVIGHVLEETDWQWSLPELTTEKRPLRIGYFGSGNSLNRKSINQFLEAYYKDKELVANSELVFAGSICQTLKIPENISATLMGKIDRINDFYNAVDIAINPMVDGTGLKIKTIEALNFGVPILSTVSGSDGLSVAASFHLAQAPQQLVVYLSKVCNHNQLLEQVQQESLVVIHKYKNQLLKQLNTILETIESIFNNRSQKKTVVVVTDAPFWGGKMGSHQRILAMCQNLKEEFLLKIFFFGSIWDDRRKEIDNAGFDQIVVSYKNFNENLDIKSIGLSDQSSFANFEGLRKKRHQSFYKTFSQYITVEKPDAVIVEYIYLAYLMDAVPEKCLSIIDTHDVMCFREYRFYQYGLHHTISMSLSLQEEKSVLERFDGILAIQDQEHLVLQKILPQKPIVLCPHSILSRNNNRVSSKIKFIGFIGADNEANKSGLEWFITQVWSVVKQLDLTLYIFGEVGKHFQDLCKTDITIKYISGDLSQEEIYSLVDCMINPVFVGGGLKIKTLEALAYGKPLISTEEGSVGIGNAQENGIMMARNRTEFIEAFLHLVNKPSLKDELICQGKNLVETKFSPESCYRPLINFLQYA